MANLKGLIQLHRFQLDEKRLALTELQKLAASLEAERDSLVRSIELEASVAGAGDVLTVGGAYSGFIKVTIERRQRLEDSMSNTALQIQSATEAVSDAFNALKKYEEAQAKRLALETAKRMRQEGQRLDEMGLEAYRRQLAARAGMSAGGPSDPPTARP